MIEASPRDLLKALMDGDPLERVAEALLSCTPVTVGGRAMLHIPMPPPRVEARRLDGVIEVSSDRPAAVVGRGGWRLANVSKTLRALELLEEPRFTVIHGVGREPRPLLSALAVALLAGCGRLPVLPAPPWVGRRRLVPIPRDPRRLLSEGHEELFGIVRGGYPWRS